MEAVSTPVVGSAHALELVHSGEVSLALVGLATAHFGVRGQREFTRKYDNVGFVMAGMDVGRSLLPLVECRGKRVGVVKGFRVAANQPPPQRLALTVAPRHGGGGEGRRLARS